MKIAFFALAFGIAASAGSAWAATTSKTIPVTLTLVNGSTVAAYLTGGGDVTTVVQHGSVGTAPSGSLPVLRIGFDLPTSGFLVKRVTWNKSRKHLTIDF